MGDDSAAIAVRTTAATQSAIRGRRVGRQMNRSPARSLVLRLMATGGLLLVLVFTSVLALSDTRTAAWCYDGHRWLPYAEGIPGSVSRDELTSCLRSAADQEHVYRFDAEVVESGILFDLGDSSLFWSFANAIHTIVEIKAYSDHVLFRDNCGREIEVRAGVATQVAPGYPCIGRERIRQEQRSLSETDFSVFVTRGEFIIDGPEGWYHARQPRFGRSEGAPLGEIPLRSTGHGVWVGVDREDIGGPEQGAILPVYAPVVGTHVDRQQFRAYDWEARVRIHMIPWSWNQSWYYLLPDWDAYVDQVRAWLDAMIDDLYHGNAEPVEFQLIDTLGWQAYASGRTIHASQASLYTILHEFAHTIAEAEQNHDGTFTATLLALWERYVPGFDRQRALELAERYSVEVGPPPHFEAESVRTTHVRQLLAKEAPVLPSDHTPIEPDELLISVVLEVGTTYDFDSNKLVATPETAPNCTVTERYSDGTTYELSHGPGAEFSVSAGGEWNGLSLVGFSGFDGGYGSVVEGTPTVTGRVRVKVTTKCPGGSDQQPKLVGWSEVIVIDPAASK